MGFTAAESGFQLNNWLSVFTTDPLESLNQQSGHTLCHIGPGKELHRIAVFKSTFAPGYLSQICRELGILVSSLSYVGVGFNHFPPAGETSSSVIQYCGLAGFRPFCRDNGGLCYCSRTFRRTIAGLPEQFADFLCRFIIKGFTETGHGVQRPPSVIIVEILPAQMSQAVAHTHQLLGPGAVIQRQLLFENVVPFTVKQPQAVGNVQRIHQLGVVSVAGKIPDLVRESHQHFLPPAILVFPSHFQADIACQQGMQDAESLLYFGIIFSHFSHTSLIQTVSSAPV